jgi:hypothetical protein
MDTWTEFEQCLLAKVPADGSAIGNRRLIRELGWNASLYWEVRQRLLDQGLLMVGRGFGGSVKRPVTEPAPGRPWWKMWAAAALAGGIAVLSFVGVETAKAIIAYIAVALLVVLIGIFWR